MYRDTPNNCMGSSPVTDPCDAATRKKWKYYAGVADGIAAAGYATAGVACYLQSSSDKHLYWMTVRPYSNLYFETPDVRQWTHIQTRWFLLGVCILGVIHHFLFNFFSPPTRAYVAHGSNPGRWVMYALALPIMNAITGNLIEPRIDIWWVVMYAVFSLGIAMYLGYAEQSALQCPSNNGEIFMNLCCKGPCFQIDLKNSSSLCWMAFFSFIFVFIRQFWVFAMVASAEPRLVQWHMIVQAMTQSTVIMYCMYSLRDLSCTQYKRELIHICLSTVTIGSWIAMVMSTGPDLQSAA